MVSTEGPWVSLPFSLFAVPVLHWTVFPHIRNPWGLCNHKVPSSSLDHQSLTASCKYEQIFLRRLCRLHPVVRKWQQREKETAVHIPAFVQWAHKLNYAIKTSMWKMISGWKVMIHTIWACFFWGEKNMQICDVSFASQQNPFDCSSLWQQWALGGWATLVWH